MVRAHYCCTQRGVREYEAGEWPCGKVTVLRRWSGCRLWLRLLGACVLAGAVWLLLPACSWSPAAKGENHGKFGQSAPPQGANCKQEGACRSGSEETCGVRSMAKSARSKQRGQSPIMICSTAPALLPCCCSQILKWAGAAASGGMARWRREHRGRNDIVGCGPVSAAAC